MPDILELLAWTLKKDFFEMHDKREEHDVSKYYSWGAVTESMKLMIKYHCRKSYQGPNVPNMFYWNMEPEYLM